MRWAGTWTRWRRGRRELGVGGRGSGLAMLADPRAPSPEPRAPFFGESGLFQAPRWESGPGLLRLRAVHVLGREHGAGHEEARHRVHGVVELPVDYRQDQPER